LGAFLLVFALVQRSPAQESGQAKQAPPTLAGTVRYFYDGIKNSITRSGDKLPEEL
jgi:hypothetical protein